MKTKLNVLTTIAALFVAQIAVACEMPAAIQIPDGSNATADEMSSASAALQQYIANVQQYQTCIEADAISNRQATKNESQRIAIDNQQSARHNAATKAITEASENFNTAVVAFEARQ